MNETASKREKNSQFYELMKELFDTQTLMFERLQSIEAKIDALPSQGGRIPGMAKLRF